MTVERASLLSIWFPYDWWRKGEGFGGEGVCVEIFHVPCNLVYIM